MEQQNLHLINYLFQLITSKEMLKPYLAWFDMAMLWVAEGSVIPLFPNL